MSPQALGQQIDNWRSAKHIHVQTLCDLIGVSRSTYNRVVLGQAELSVGAFTRLMGALSISIQDLTAIGPQYFNLTQSAKNVRQQIEQARAGMLADAQLLALHAEYMGMTLDLYNPGYSVLVSCLALAVQEQRNEKKRAQETANLIIRRLTATSQWFEFEYDVLMILRRYVTVADWVLLTRHQLAGLLNQTELGQERIVTVGRTFLDTALATQDAQAVWAAITWLRLAPLNSRYLTFQILRAFVNQLARHLQGEAETYPAWRAQIVDIQAGEAVAQFDRWWALAERIAPAPQERRLAAIPAPKIRPTNDLAELIQQLSHNRGVNGGELAKMARVSTSTYYRALKDYSRAKIDFVFWLLDCLGLGVTDLRMLWRPARGPQTRLLRQLAKLGQQQAHLATAAQAFDDQLALQYQKTPYPAIPLVRKAAGILTGELLKRPAQVKQAVGQLWQELIMLDAWTQFDYELVLLIVEYLPYVTITRVLKRQLAQLEQREASVSDGSVDFLMTELLISAVRSGPNAVEDAVALWHRIHRREPSRALIISGILIEILAAAPAAQYARYQAAVDALAAVMGQADNQFGALLTTLRPLLMKEAPSVQEELK